MTHTPSWFHPQGPSPLQRSSGQQGLHNNSEYHAAMTPGGDSSMANEQSGGYHGHSSGGSMGPSPPMMHQQEQQHHMHSNTSRRDSYLSSGGSVSHATPGQQSMRMNNNLGTEPMDAYGNSEAHQRASFPTVHQNHFHHQQHHNMYAQSHSRQHHHSSYQSNPMAHYGQPPHPMGMVGGPNRGMMGHHDFSTLHQQRAFHHHRQQHQYDPMIHPTSPSPPTIPPPPTEAPKSVPKYRALSDPAGCSHRQPSLEADSAGPLRESTHRHNSISSGDDTVDHKNPTPAEAQKGSAQRKADKPTNVQDASLLLGLRTNASPDTTPRENKEGSTTQKPQDQPVEGEEKANPATEGSEMPYALKPFPTRLSLQNDRANLNSLHCFIRSELLEIFVIEGPKDNSMAGRIGMQCVHCSLNRPKDPKRENEATMAVFYPRSISEIYRLVTNWTRCHLSKCKNIPPSVRSYWDSLRAVDKSRGKVAYWIESAKQLGMVDITSTKAGGVTFVNLLHAETPTSPLADQTAEEQEQQQETTSFSI